MAKIEDTIRSLHQASYYENTSETDQSRREIFPKYLADVEDESILIQLPDAAGFFPADNDLLSVLSKRRSVRHYNTQQLMSQIELAYLLKFTQGLREFDQKRQVSLRYVPSAGSRHPFETYLLIQHVEGLQAGIYHYIAHKNALLVVSLEENEIKKAHESALKQRQVRTSAVTFFWVAEVYRTSWRYAERAYRYINLDAGHVCQNLYLCAESIGFGVCAIAAFDDHLANRLLNLDDHESFVVYIASVGQKLAD